jgi:uncharacterized protein YggE
MTLGRMLLGSVVSLAAGSAIAQATTDARFSTTTLDVGGHGEAHLPPDVATIEVGVAARAAKAAAAEAQAAAAMTQVIGVLKARGIAPRDIQTSELGVEPQYAEENGGPQRLTGYLARYRVSVRVEDLTGLGSAIDAAVDAGANDVGPIEFGLKSPGSAEGLARLAAVKDLEDKAEAYANAAGYKIRRLVNLSETGTGGLVLQPRPVLAMAKAATPVEAGEITVSVDITGEFELAR